MSAPGHSTDKLVVNWRTVFQGELEALGKDAKDFGAGEDADHVALTPPTASADQIQRNYLTGLCLSGGGVRAAIVGLGAMETLAKAGMLRHFDYLSTVSGGGYAGAAMSHFWAMQRQLREESETADSPELCGFWKEMGHPFDQPDEEIADARTRLWRRRQEIEDQYRRDLIAADIEPPAEDEPRPSAFARREDAYLHACDEAISQDALGDKGMRSLWGLTGAQSMAERYLRHLRIHVNYLMPDGAAGALSGAYVVARAILLNLFIWIVLGAGAIALLRRLGDWVGAFPLPEPLSFMPSALSPAADAQNLVFLISVLAAAGLAILIPLTMVGFSLSSYFVATSTDEAFDRSNKSLLLRYAIGSAAIVAGAFGYWRYGWQAGLTPLALAIVVGLYIGAAWAYGGVASADPRTSSFKYRRRRFFESISGRLLLIVIILAAFGAAPIIGDNLHEMPESPGVASKQSGMSMLDDGLVGMIVSLVGVAAGVFGYVRERLTKAPGIATKLLVPLGAVLFVYGAILLAYLVARDYWTLQNGLMWALTMVALCLAACVNINDVSLGRFYRDRLMETFMPDPEVLEAGVADEAKRPAAARADKLRLTDLEPKRPQEETGGRDHLLHLVCCNLVTSETADRKAQRRKGDSFVLSGLFCGSDTTQWKPTEQVAGGQIRLATAMAISGAAVNPQGGVSGGGPTTGPIVSLAMSLLSLRLGYWLRWSKRPALLQPLNPYGNHIQPGLLLALGRLLNRRGAAENAAGFREIADGGHFENLGIYELVRRRCGLIVACDGEADPTASYQNFTNALRRIEDDFGARVSFDVEIDGQPHDPRQTEMRLSGPQDIVMRGVDTGFPKGVEFAAKGYFLATIQYSDTRRDPDAPGYRAQAPHGPELGLLIYMKSTMLESLAATTKGYRGVNPAFPFDPTHNQMFSSVQFEAYRNVGCEIAAQMMRETALGRLFGADRPRLEQVLSNPAFQVQSPKA